MDKSPSNSKTTSRFFVSWTGHRHPLVPEKPIKFEDIGNHDVVYRAELDSSRNAKRLLVFEKLSVNANWCLIDSLIKAGECYSVQSNGKENYPGDLLKHDAALALKRWFLAYPGVEDRLQLIEIELISKTIYDYGSDSSVSRLIIEDKSGRYIHQAE